LKAGSEKQRKENKEKTKRQKLTKTSFERFHEADDEGGTARDLLQHLRHLKQYRSEYAEYEDYATISFRICRIWFNMDKMVQNGSNCGFVLNYLFLLNIFTHSALIPLSVFVLIVDKALSFIRTDILLLYNELLFV